MKEQGAAMDTGGILEGMARAVLEGDEELARESARAALAAGVAPRDAIAHGFSKGMERIGQQFECGEAFLPELLLAANAFRAAMGVIRPAIEASQQVVGTSGKVALATVKGDIHGIGKDIVGTVMEVSGFEVFDLGVNQPSLEIIEAAKKHCVDIIALSSLMTTTMPYQREVIDTLKEMKIREKYLVLVGGGPVTQAWADEIGADGYGCNAFDAVRVATALLGPTRR